MRRRILIVSIAIILALALIGGLLSRTPVWRDYFAWRIDFALAYARGVLHPVGQVPTALPPPAMAVTSLPSPTPTATLTPVPVTPTVGPTATATPSPTPIPASASLNPPAYEKQDINNCGPATLAMNLRYYGWEGDQFDIAELLKPQREDRNVNVEDLIFYVRTRAGWLNAEFRVGGDLEILKRLLAAGLPVMVEESFYFEEPYWPNDDLWAAHYNLLTGYDEAAQTFTGQDSFVGPDRQIPYATLKKDWQSFNYVYILIYPPDQQATVESILGEHWDVDANRQHALDLAQAETEAQPDNAYTWFNLGTNLVYFERYNEAAGAYDKARQLGLPQRMLRYQFGPFFAYFHNRRMDDLAALTDYALQITPNSEEALLWRGWMHFRQGDSNAAVADFQAALAENPNYQDARYAIDFVRQSQ